MATLAFGGPVCDGATNPVVVRDHVDRPRVGPMLPGEGRLAAAPSPGVARVALGRLMGWLRSCWGGMSGAGKGRGRPGRDLRTERSRRTGRSLRTARRQPGLRSGIGWWQ
jgi:hypothetical protein